MYRIRCIALLWFIPCSWIDAILVRKKPFEERYTRLSRWAKRFFGIFAVHFQVEQSESLPEDIPLLFVSNHQSEFDMIMLNGGIPRAFSYISKVENQKTPYVSSWSKALEIIFFDREDRTSAIHMLREAARRLKSQKNLLIFPEGTRSKGTTMHEMQAGSLQPAFMAKAAIVPVVLVNSYDYMNVVKHKGTFKMKILKPILFDEYKPMKAEGVVKYLQELMQKELSK